MAVAAQNSAPDATERRIAPRFQPAFGTVFRYRPNDESDYPALGLVWNISETGVSMLLADPPTRGDHLLGELTSEAGGPGLAIGVKVVHVREMPVGDFFLGARFDRPLGQEELKRFLVSVPAPNPPQNGQG